MNTPVKVTSGKDFVAATPTAAETPEQAKPETIGKEDADAQGGDVR